MPDSFSPDDPDAAERAVALLKSLSHVGRLRILCSLLQSDRTVGDLSSALQEPQASVSQQLMRLRAEGLVKCTRHGKTVTYSLGRSESLSVIRALRECFCANGAIAVAPDSDNTRA